MANIKKSAPKLNPTQFKALEDMDTTSSKIRYLCGQGYSRADVARALNIRYQWVRGVMEQPLKKS